MRETVSFLCRNDPAARLPPDVFVEGFSAKATTSGNVEWASGPRWRLILGIAASSATSSGDSLSGDFDDRVGSDFARFGTVAPIFHFRCDLLEELAG